MSNIKSWSSTAASNENQECVHLLAERNALLELLKEMPEDDVLDRGMLIGRLEEIEALITPEDAQAARRRSTTKNEHLRRI
jgi:hypothetical protein